jgi:anti-sigma regulatory factor (Ser/Thr protein kinase)
MEGRTIPPTTAFGIRLAREPAAAGCARRRIAAELVARGLPAAVVEVAEVIVSELVTNSLTYGQGEVQVLLDHWCGCWVLTVTHQKPYRPLPAAVPAHESAESGRGLFLVKTLAQRWGHRPVAEGDARSGTAVWAVLPDAAA